MDECEEKHKPIIQEIRDLKKEWHEAYYGKNGDPGIKGRMQEFMGWKESSKFWRTMIAGSWLLVLIQVLVVVYTAGRVVSSVDVLKDEVRILRQKVQ